MSAQPNAASKDDHPEVEHNIGSKDKSVGWYDKEFRGVPEDARKLLEGYSHIPSEEVENHVLEAVGVSTPEPLPDSR